MNGKVRNIGKKAKYCCLRNDLSDLSLLLQAKKVYKPKRLGTANVLNVWQHWKKLDEAYNQQLFAPEAALVITRKFSHDWIASPANHACLIYPTVNDAVKVRMEGGVMEECEASADVLQSDTMDQYRTFQMCERLLHSPAKLGNQLLFQIPPHRQAILIERCSKDALINSLSIIWRVSSVWSDGISHLNHCLSCFFMFSNFRTCLFLEQGYLPLRADISMAGHSKWHYVFIFCLCVSLFRYYAFDDAFVREVLGKKLSKGTKKDLDDIGAKTGVTLKSCRRQVSAFWTPQWLFICIITFKMVSAHDLS